MSQSKQFAVADLSLRDCWKVVKGSFGCWLELGAMYCFSILVGWGYEAGRKSVFGVDLLEEEMRDGKFDTKGSRRFNQGKI